MKYQVGNLYYMQDGRACILVSRDPLMVDLNAKNTIIELPEGYELLETMPETAKYHTVQSLDEHISALRGQVHHMRESLIKVSSEYAQVVGKLAAVDSVVANIHDVLDRGAVWFVTTRRPYEIIDGKSFFSPRLGAIRGALLRLELHMDANGDLMWGIRDADNSSRQYSKWYVLPFNTREEAVAKLGEMLDEKIRAGVAEQYIVDTAEKYGIRLTARYRDLVKMAERRKVVKEIEQYQRKIVVLRESLENGDVI